MYKERVNVGPIWTKGEAELEYAVSPAVRNVLAWSSREGEIVVGRDVDKLAPEVVMARLISGTASSILLNTFRIWITILFSSSSFWCFG